ncbi:MAG TPA: IS110 family transposase [Streptosporangiaceae bacterium]|nr:IS110 family transposase [Streptosporangiaceae bacterium]
MVVLGVDAHKRSHTVVAVDEAGRKLGQRTAGTTSGDHLALLAWAQELGGDRLWAVEDCRQLSRRLERDLLGAGEQIVRVPPKMMAHARDAARSYGKSDPIDALAVARAVLREPGLPSAQLDGPARQVRLLVDHRDDLVAERTRAINRLRWHLHELDPAWDPPARSLWRPRHLTAILGRLDGDATLVARLARSLALRCQVLTGEISQLDAELGELTAALAPELLKVCGCATLTAAKIIGETAGIGRFRSRHAYARHNGTAPLPVWSGNRERHRLSRAGNRQLNAALHRIAITQAHYHPGARAFLERRRAGGNTKPESLRALKRRLSDVVYRALLADAEPGPAGLTTAA